MLNSDSVLVVIITLFCIHWFIFFRLLAATFTADKVEKDEIQRFHKFYRMRFLVLVAWK